MTEEFLPAQLSLPLRAPKAAPRVAVPKGPLRQVVSRELRPTGPRGGQRLWLYLDCGHAVQRIPHQRQFYVSRVRCLHQSHFTAREV